MIGINEARRTVVVAWRCETCGEDDWGQELQHANILAAAAAASPSPSPAPASTPTPAASADNTASATAVI